MDRLFERTHTPEEIVIHQEFIKTIRKMLEMIPVREADIIRLRYGIDCKQLTLREVGERYGLSASRVRQLQHKGLRRLRHPKRCGLLDGFTDRWTPPHHHTTVYEEPKKKLYRIGSYVTFIVNGCILKGEVTGTFPKLLTVYSKMTEPDVWHSVLLEDVVANRELF